MATTHWGGTGDKYEELVCLDAITATVAGTILKRFTLQDSITLTRIEMDFETDGNADNSGTVDVKDDGVSVLSTPFALTDASKAVVQVATLATNTHVAAGSEITIVGYVGGTSAAFNRVTVKIFGRPSAKST